MLFQRIEKVIQSKQLFSLSDTVIVAVSGGADSVTLLHLLSTLPLKLKLIAVYVDHGLRPYETHQEIDLVKRLCIQLGIIFKENIVDTYAQKRQHKNSLEEAARILRYQSLEKMRKEFKAHAIAVAHTADDQAEELLIRLIRGTGKKGLSGMTFQKGHIVRPLLEETKATLLEYLKKHNIPYCYDSSNSDKQFLRNRVRLDLLPLLEKQFNASIRQNLLQTADILRQEDLYLEELTQAAYKKVIHHHKTPLPSSVNSECIILKILPFSTYHLSIQRRLLENILWQMATKPGFRQIQQLTYLITQGKDGAALHLQEGLRINKEGEYVIFSHPSGKMRYRGNGLTKCDDITMELPSPGTYFCDITQMRITVGIHDNNQDFKQSSSLVLDADAISFPLLLRSPKQGDTFSPLGMKGRKKVMRFLSDSKVPPAKRHLYPLLLFQSKILAIAGLRIDNGFRVLPQTKRVLIVDWEPLEKLTHCL